MPLKRYWNYLTTQDGKIWNEASNWKWNNTNSDNNIVVGENHIYRVQIDVPRGSTINWASFKTEFRVKDGNTIPQNATFSAFLELDADPYPIENEIYIAPHGPVPPYPRRRMSSSGSYTVNYTTNTPEADFVEFAMGGLLQQLIDHPDYEPGQYISVIISPTAETGDISFMTMNQTFASEQPNVKVEYVEPYDFARRERYEVNMLGLGTFDTHLENWGTHSGYGTYTENVTLARTTARSRRGGASLQVTPTVTDAVKGFMAYSNVGASKGKSYVFTGWVYVPSTNPRDFRPHFLYDGSSAVTITEKDKWVPFCTNPTTVGVDHATIWPAVSSAGASNPAYTFFVDDLAVVESKHRIYPFDDSSTNHRRIITKNFYTAGLPAVVRKSDVNTSAHVNPFIVLDDMDTTANWSITSGASFGITMDTFNGGVRFNIPAGNYGYNVEYNLPAGHFRRKRYFVVNSQHTTLQPASLGTVTNSDGAEMAFFPTVVRTEAAGVGTRRFYDIPQGLGRLSSLIFSFSGNASAATSVIFYDIGEADRPTAQATMMTSSKWTLKDGMWVRTSTDRQSATFDDAASGSGHAIAGMTLSGLIAQGKTYNELESL